VLLLQGITAIARQAIYRVQLVRTLRLQIWKPVNRAHLEHLGLLSQRAVQSVVVTKWDTETEKMSKHMLLRFHNLPFTSTAREGLC
jgi:hypothetical protein